MVKYLRTRDEEITSRYISGNDLALALIEDASTDPYKENSGDARSRATDLQRYVQIASK
jgi:hypothetical protein